MIRIYILRLKPLIFYHLKNFLLVKTEKDREEAMDPGTFYFSTGEPQIQLYFLLGLVYAVVTPFLLPYIVVFFGLAYLVYRHQIINVYNQEYESAGAFWPDVHGRIVFALVVLQLLLMGLLSTKEAANSTPLLIALPVLTIWFHRFCKGSYEPTFTTHPLQEAMVVGNYLELEETENWVWLCHLARRAASLAPGANATNFLGSVLAVGARRRNLARGAGARSYL
ncbi:hypothetical protein TSUD_250520 [Trifolium subterraneum]|nr:hypothetical protein TSUD_250520 [Trifolium subterraneum]